MRPELDPDPAWVAALTGASRAESEAALAEARDAGGLFRHLARAHRAEGRRSYIEIDAPLELHAIARLARPRELVEVGVSSGVSSAYLLDALDRNGAGTLHSIDLPSRPRASRTGGRKGGSSWSLPPGRSSGWAIPRRLRPRWDLRLGDKADLLPLLAAELPAVDLLLYDVPHEDRDAGREFGLFADLLRPGGVVIADHGPGGGMCAGLRAWARRSRASPVRREGLGLFGFRRPPLPTRGPAPRR